MLLVWLQVLDDCFLLPKFCSEELWIALELIRQPLLWLVQEFGFIVYSLQVNIINFSLDIVEVVSPFIVSVLVENWLDISIHSLLLLVKLVHNIVIHSLLLWVNTFDFTHLLPKLSQPLNFWCKLSLSFLDFRVNLLDSGSDFLKSLIFLMVQHFLLIWDSLDLIFNVRVSLDAFSPFEILHEFAEIICSTF